VTTPAARRLLAGELPEGAAGFTFPLDLPLVAGRVASRLRPRLFVAVETEIWPNLLAALDQQGSAAALVNGRIGDVSWHRYRRVTGLLRRAWRPVRLVCARSPLDAERFLSLGLPADRLMVSGDLKLARPAPSRAELPGELAPLLAGRRVLVAGSTHAGEETVALAAGTEAAAAGVPVAVVLAPRHLGRLEEVERTLRESGWTWCRRTRPLQPAPAPDRPLAVLLDTHGELAALYPHAHAALLGGTLAPVGGHNPLEAAAAGVPQAAGPHQGNVRELAAALEDAGALVTAADAGALSRRLADWLVSPPEAATRGRAGAELVAREQGALERTLEALLPLASGAGAGT
jgi:3-deoxy-D-manno-octulosonic-acid transferase